MTPEKIGMYVILTLAMIGLIAAIVIIPLAIFDSVEKFGDELHDYFEGDDE